MSRLLRRTVLCADAAGLAQTCANMLARAVREKPDALLCLAAGETAVETYALVRELAGTGALDLTATRFVQLDEWLDIEDESQNCGAFLQKHFYGPLGITHERIERFDIHAADLDVECARMDGYLAREGPIDFLLLGVGLNGHLGLNEPGVPWDRGALVAKLDDTTLRVGQKYFEGGQKLSRGITLGMRHLLGARSLVLQASGEKKAEIIRKIYETQPTEDLPATALHRADNAVVVLDRDAASLLPREEG